MHLPQNFDNKSGFPYLVDIKISDYCPFGCEFCFQSSTKKGQHADKHFLSNTLVDTLYKAGVLEVNFGGGETTLYDGGGYGTLEYILSCYKHKKFKVGVTTKNYNWHKNKNFADCIKLIDSVAISVNSLEDLKAAEELEKEIYKLSDATIYYQCIFELVPYEEFQKFIQEVSKKYEANVTLLGYKDFGFGKGGHKYSYPDEWISFVKDIHEENELNIGIDSKMVENWRQKLIDFGIPNYYLVGTEGKSTCYIDAVKKKMYSSSSSNEEGMDLPKSVYDKNDFLENFAKL